MKESCFLRGVAFFVGEILIYLEVKNEGASGTRCELSA